MSTGTSEIIKILVLITLTTACARLGAILFLKRLSLVSDALSHIALPGMALFLLLHKNPLWGGFIALILGCLFVWWVEEKTRIYPEALVGTVFVFSLALGSLLLGPTELLEAFLGGGLQEIGRAEILGSLFLLFLLGYLFLFRSKALFLEVFSKELAYFLKPSLRKDKLLFYLTVGATLGLGAKVLGILLIGAIFILPPTIAKLYTRSLKGFLNLSSMLGGSFGLLGYLISQKLWIPLSPVIVLLLSSFFALSLFVKMVFNRARSSGG